LRPVCIEPYSKGSAGSKSAVGLCFQQYYYLRVQNIILVTEESIWLYEIYHLKSVRDENVRSD